MEPGNNNIVVQHVNGSNNGRATTPTEYVDVDLVRRTKNGDVSAFRELFDRYYKRVYNIVYRVVSDENEAADITQEVFVKVYKSIDKLKAEEAFFTWIRMVAVNLCRDYIRRKPAVRVESLDQKLEVDGNELDKQVADWSNNPHKHLEKKDLQNAVQKAIKSLSDDHRTVVVLHHIEGMDIQNIADLLGSPVGTIKSRLARARDELKRKLGGYLDVE